MSTATVTSTDSSNPTSVYGGSKRLVRVKNLDASITLHVRDPRSTTPTFWVDLPPGEDHVFQLANYPGSMVAYGSSGGASLLVNEIG
jgi:hypothetical protein